MAFASALPFAVYVALEHEILVGRHAEPAVRLELGIELARRPTGIAERQQVALRSLAATDRAQDVKRRGHRELLAHCQRRLFVIVGRVQHETAAGLDGPAEMHRARLVEAGRFELQMGHQLVHRQRGEQLVDDEAHRPVLLAMGADIDDRACETRVRHLRHRHEKLAG